ncbi:MAG: V-type ATPase subunit [Candidatus Nanohaloarchaea archaeon]
MIDSIRKIREKIAPRDYPYMYARVSAKATKLLDQSDYENLLKMEPNEIAKNLGEGAYKDEIDELGSNYEGARLVELALSKNLSSTMRELLEMAPGPLENVIETYLRRYDIVSLKRLLRWKKSGEGDIIHLFTPVSSFDHSDLEEMKEKEFGEIVDGIEFDSDVDYQEFLSGKETLREIENALDRAYYTELEDLAERTGSPEFRRFIEREMEYQNLRIAMRLKRYGMEGNDIEEMLVDGRDSETLTEVLEAEDHESALKKIQEMEEIESSSEIEDLEHALQVKRNSEALKMLHTEPLGLTSILGYVVAKINEVKNLRTLVKARETGVYDREEIKDNLVIPG